MTSELLIVLAVVLTGEPSDEVDAATRIRDLRGRELPGVPGSWVSQVAVHPYPHASVGSSTTGHAPRGQNPAGTAPRAGAPDDNELSEDELDHELDLDFGVHTRDA